MFIIRLNFFKLPRTTRLVLYTATCINGQYIWWRDAVLQCVGIDSRHTTTDTVYTDTDTDTDTATINTSRIALWHGDTYPPITHITQLPK